MKLPIEALYQQLHKAQEDFLETGAKLSGATETSQSFKALRDKLRRQITGIKELQKTIHEHPDNERFSRAIDELESKLDSKTDESLAIYWSGSQIDPLVEIQIHIEYRELKRKLRKIKQP